MLRTLYITSILLISLAAGRANAADLPEGFVYLRAVAPQIQQDIRYAGNHNFIGRPISGYEAAECILTKEAAIALAAAADELAKSGMTLAVYDCYRPASAVADFVNWARMPDELAMQAEFYPRVDKARLFELGYIAERSGHSRGSTVDLAVLSAGKNIAPTWQPGETLVDCALPSRHDENLLNFGTDYDCFDLRAHHGADGIDEEATRNRAMLADLLISKGFKPYAEEWWHYTLANEPFPDTYFEFPITPQP